MEKIISQEEFELMVKELTAKHWKMKQLLESAGGYENLPQNVKDKIDKELKIKREIVLKIID